ncbi:MAG: hypothetical protein M1820_006517 [Bogoriella megaspora]|nr:MAG: hypothetical protein M1820_006517 [Bogoriella megaspora]
MDGRGTATAGPSSNTRQKTSTNVNGAPPTTMSSRQTAQPGSSRSHRDLAASPSLTTPARKSSTSSIISNKAPSKSSSPRAQPASNRSKETLGSPAMELSSESATIREMTQIFLSRSELLAPGDSLEQQRQWQKEEAASVQHDRTNTHPFTGGLFKGCFKNPVGRPMHFPLRDVEDGVDRCPYCHWELEDGECTHCQMTFDEAGAIRSNFGGFSEMDPSEGDFIDEMDHELDMEDAEFEEDMALWEQYGHGSIDGAMMQAAIDRSHVNRWLHHPANAAGGLRGVNRRHVTHSALGSRQHSYSASLASYSEDTEMGTVEEEDEDMDEDSSMNGFVDDEASEETSEASSPRRYTRPSPLNNSSRRSRRVEIASPTNTSGSSMSPSPSYPENDDDDEDEGGPVSNGRRRVVNVRPRRRLVISESDEGSISTEHNMEEQRQALIDDGWSSLDQDSLADQEPVIDYGDDGEEEGDDSDGGRTTVGWEPTTISHDRLHNAGSLTPTADRPNRTTRPDQSGQPRLPRVPSGLRGLRRRSSILSTTSTANPEEADDDDSEVDQADREGDLNDIRLRHRLSRARMLRSMRFQNINSSVNTGSGSGNSGDLDSDSTSDASTIPGQRGQRPRARRQEYDSRISWMFAQYQADVREMSSGHVTGLESLDTSRVRTPVSRPRTANRNRTSTQTPVQIRSGEQVVNQVVAPPRQFATLRTQVGQDQASLHALNSPLSGGSGAIRAQLGAEAHARGAFDIAALLGHTNNNGGVPLSNNMPNHRNSGSMGRHVTGQQVVNNVAPSPTAANRNSVPSTESNSRPASRNMSRPGSTTGRRIQTLQTSQPQSLNVTPGLNFAARHIQAAQSNPYAMYLRRRQSNQRLQQQPSTATLRARGSTRTLRPQPSQVSIQEPTSPPSPRLARQQTSRIQLRAPPSQQRLSQQNTAPVRNINTVTSPTLSNSNNMPRPNPTPAARPVSIPQANQTTSASAINTTSGTSRMSEEERLRRASELVARRTQELSTSNPYAQINRQRSNGSVTTPSSSASSLRTSASPLSASSTSISTTSTTSDAARPVAPAAARVRAADASRPLPNAWATRPGSQQSSGGGAGVMDALRAVNSGTVNRNRAEQIRT